MSGDKTEFDDWLAERFGALGSFTVLIVLLKIDDLSVDLLRSTHLHVVGDEVNWSELSGMFESAGVAWNGAAFFTATPGEPGSDALVPDASAKRQLADLVERLNENRLVLNEGDFFDRAGRRLRIEEATAH